MYHIDNIPAFIVGVIAFGLTVSSYQCLNQRQMFFVRIFADLSWAVHWFLLGGFSAAIALFIAMFRTSLIVFYRPQWKIFLIPISILIILGMTFFSPEESLYKYLPWMASSCMAISLYYHENFMKCRSIMMVGAIVWIVYAVVMGSLPVLITMIIITLSHAIGMIRYIRKPLKTDGHV